MCVVSNTGDYWGQRLHPWSPYTPPLPYIPPAQMPDITKIVINPTGPTKDDFDNLKKEVQIMKEQLARAKEYDKANGEPDCEIEDKMAFLREVAKLVGIDLDEVLKKDSANASLS